MRTPSHRRHVAVAEFRRLVDPAAHRYAVALADAKRLRGWVRAGHPSSPATEWAVVEELAEARRLLKAALAGQAKQRYRFSAYAFAISEPEGELCGFFLDRLIKGSGHRRPTTGLGTER